MANNDNLAETALLHKAIVAWIKKLNDYPGWKEWKRGHFANTLWYADPIPLRKDIPEEFKFSGDVEVQHALCLQFLSLQTTINSLRDLQYYFRRFPFRGLPVTRYEHVTNICEMYFSRFYEFKTRLQAYFETFKKTNPTNTYDYGQFIRTYTKAFDAELRARNGVHHHKRFDSMAIDNLFLTHSIVENGGDLGWKEEHLAAYRQVVKEWTSRINRRSKTMDIFLNAVATMTLDSCEFLNPKD